MLNKIGDKIFVISELIFCPESIRLLLMTGLFKNLFSHYTKPVDVILNLFQNLLYATSKQTYKSQG